MRRLAIVVQRYGREVGGGAESHARWVAQRLRGRFEVTVYTSTALDYVTWENHYAPGTEEFDGALVRRFPVEGGRDLELFNRYSRWIFAEPHRDADEERWLLLQGPVVPGLVEALRRDRTAHDIFLFFTYLYYPTVKGVAEVGRRAVLYPTAHDEPPIRLRLYRRLFAAPAAFMLNTEVERRFLERLFDLGHRPRVVVGMGIDWPEPDPDPAPTLERLGIGRPYALSFGRLTAGKGHDLVVKSFVDSPVDLDLVLFGTLEMELPDDPRVRHLGFISDEEKWAVIAGARFTVHPSPYESLSLALLESWAVGVPALVNAECAVLADHIERCGGGLAYRGGDDFVRQVEAFGADEERGGRMGEAGRGYVRSRYAAAEVADRYAEFLDRMIELRS